MKRVIDEDPFFDNENPTFFLRSIDAADDNAEVYQPSQILEYLRELRVDGAGSDITVQVGNVSYALHKLILRRSPYFANLFDEFVEDQKVVNLDILVKGSLVTVPEFFVDIQIRQFLRTL
jgi:hypothetical protein